ncbi:Nicotinate dehydrogenase large molybdopterin subunit [Moorella humiferrea]|uniref:Nicotinate dehydrogenase large molybdopterin subunit n=1 Tax=Neomoorella humiferrea TaxID=676965 RepID=A0A2T0AKH0_9FIRM|nr:xanthine dehydrogenase family protein molybdopterin-binding subunit [Moorella humiferrea]PRR69065.1 Nicotinate dehydrogenase large molybdopterin subunit [Moorella humiferrea]
MGKVIGQRIPLYDSYRHTTGQTKYVDDIYLPGMLYVKTAKIPVPHARILNIDTSAAERVAGVAGVITYKDVPNNYWGPFVQDQPVLPDKFVRYLGQPVVAVAAVDEDTAYEAVDKVKIDYEELTPVFDPEEAMQPGAPEVHEGGNIAKFGGYDAMMVRLGDVEKGFAESDYIIEHKFRTSMNEHASLEPHCSVAEADANGHITIYTASQTTSWHQFLICGVLGVPINTVRIVSSPTGGGFGGKSNPSTEFVCALLARKTGKPVKWRWTREEEFLISTVRSADIMWMKTGFKKDGTLVARKIRYIQDTGAYNDFGTYGMMKLTSQINGPYRIPNVWFDGYVVYTNKQVTGPMRGYSITQSVSANETQMEIIAEITGLDPIEVRMKNLLKDGDILPTQQVLEAVGVRETLEAVIKASGWYNK